MRGKLIQLSSQLRKTRKADIEKLEIEFLSLNKQRKQNWTLVSIDKIDAARKDLNLALTAIAEKSLRWSGAYFYHQKDKVGSMLAARLTPRLKTHTLPKIKSNVLSQNPQKIMEAFHDYYKKLYSEGKAT